MWYMDSLYYGLILLFLPFLLLHYPFVVEVKLVCIMISISSLNAGASLKYLIKEANNKIQLIEDRMKRDK